MPTWEEDDWLPLGRNHEFQTDAADVGLDLTPNLLVELLGSLFVLAVGRLSHLADQIGSVVLHPFLNGCLLDGVLMLALLVPDAPFLLMLPDCFLVVHNI